MAADEASSVRSPEVEADEPTATVEAPLIPEIAAKATSPSSKKRSALASEPSGTTKVTKRRAARACVSCRARKVRCDVVEGAPCGNCRWDNVECIVQESRRRKKNLFDSTLSNNTAPQSAETHPIQLKAKTSAPVNITAAPLRRPSEVSQFSNNSNEGNGQTGIPDGGGLEGHVPHMIYQRSGGMQLDPLMLAKLQTRSNASRYPSIWPSPRTDCHGSVSGDLRTAQFLNTLEEPDASSHLPGFIRPLPAKIAAEDVAYLSTKGALTLPTIPLQNALLRCYIEYVHPYMPLIDLNEFLTAVNSRDGLCGQISLLLYQAIMFSATAFVESKFLKDAGYPSRKAARKASFYKARLLYDFDYESDRLVLVQGLLLMTYWYETPDDQKDTWHWMGVAISLAHTIGLHRNPTGTNMSPRKKSLWKRIWWCCFMRDRLVALGMRRPTRIKDEDFDVPMLEEGDFEIESLAEGIQIIGDDCTLMRDISMQQELALLCIEKAKLCLCISHMLKAQYSVLIRDKAKPENTTNSTMMLFPNKQLDNMDSVKNCDVELVAWLKLLPACCQYRPLTCLDIRNGRSTVAVQRNLLHMVYYTTVSALHRPQFLPSSPMHAPQTSAQVQELSRMRVRDAATQITRMISEMHTLRLEKYLPTTGVTVVLPAMIIHLLEMKSPLSQTRENALHGFRQCMMVMEKLRDSYSAADYAVGFLDAALRKASIDLQIAHQSQAQDFNPVGGQDQGQGDGLKTAAAAVPPFPSFTANNNPTLEDMATPPPDPSPYEAGATVEAAAQGNMSQVSAANLFPPSMSQAFAPPADIMSGAPGAGVDAASALALMSGGPSPPHTEKEMMTPSASGSSASEGHAAPLDVEMDFDATVDHQDEFDWNAITGTNIDFDQWLQFPPGNDGGGKAAPTTAKTAALLDVPVPGAGARARNDFGGDGGLGRLANCGAAETPFGLIVNMAEVDGTAALMGIIDADAEGVVAVS
ncbi:hypothetical protein DL766_008214 [Monosporascus sp. MC13-8B]|uniref:Zn(2)-C6 fungal-type domain-containing protein n=1 Tax=Monosporascus cannonballus TaxID=155416 RepID=A0ABY0GXI2_9PEZI|nr:hypothetical protein DL762_008215 [Monosporascus cannonballus]RYP20355.1 hypothetical protein DL766_008214 [Monosporascus sp. MC13-8B]